MSSATDESMSKPKSHKAGTFRTNVSLKNRKQHSDVLRALMRRALIDTSGKKLATSFAGWVKEEAESLIARYR